jgi:hypothetical protein
LKKPKSINELLSSGGARLLGLKAASEQRSIALEQVRAALPEELRATVVSAGLEHRRLTIGVASASWAARLRYVTETLRLRVGASLGADIDSVRIRVVRPKT